MVERLAKGEDALELSIEKWENVEKGGSSVERGWQNCALCEEFLRNEDACGGCVVAEKTGQIHCRATPYQEYLKAVDSGASEKELVVIARKEIEFLKSLRKK